MSVPGPLTPREPGGATHVHTLQLVNEAAFLLQEGYGLQIYTRLQAWLHQRGTEGGRGSHLASDRAWHR